MIKIDKNVPIPNREPGPGRPRKYPWLEMKIGDSFLEPKRSVLQAASKASRLYDRRFLCRTTPEGVRVWRIA